MGHPWFSEFWFFLLCGLLVASWASVCLLGIPVIHCQVWNKDYVCSFPSSASEALLMLLWHGFRLHVIMLASLSDSIFSLSFLKCDPQKTIQNPTQDRHECKTLACLRAVISSQSPSVLFKQIAPLCAAFAVSSYVSCSWTGPPVVDGQLTFWAPKEYVMFIFLFVGYVISVTCSGIL